MSDTKTNDSSDLSSLEASITSMISDGVDFSSNTPVSGLGNSDESSKTVNEDEKGNAKPDNNGDSKTEGSDKTPDGNGTQESNKSEEDNSSEESDDKSKDANKKENSSLKDTKESREEQRKDKSWKTLQAKREAFEKEEKERKESWDKFVKEQKEQLAKEIESAKKAREEFESKKQEEELKGSPEQYERIAKDADARGDTRIAELAREQAEFIRSKQAEQKAFQEKRRIESMQQERIKWTAKAVEELPELNDTSSEIHKEAVELLKNNKDLAELPRAPWFAGQFVKLQKDLKAEKALASRVPLLEKEKADLIKQIDDLKKRMSPSTLTSNTPLTKPKNAGEDMSVDEIENKLREVLSQNAY